MAVLVFPTIRDNYLYSGSAGTNYGTTTTMRAGRDASTGFVCRAIMTFDLTPLIGHTVALAKLRMNVTVAGGTQACTLYRVTQPAWSEIWSTWNNYTLGTKWDASGGDYTDVDAAAIELPAAAGIITFPLETLTQDAITSRSGLLHLLLKRTVEAGVTQLHTIATRESADGPLLEVITDGLPTLRRCGRFAPSWKRPEQFRHAY